MGTCSASGAARHGSSRLCKRTFINAVALPSWAIQTCTAPQDVRVDVKLNQEVFKQGVRNVPVRLRVAISRRRNEEEDASDEMYSYVTVSVSLGAVYSAYSTR